MKSLPELSNGDCNVIAEFNGEIKTFEGFYDQNMKVVFFVIPERYNVIGYNQ